ncbi:hypothetical protein MP228_011018 [Amoeboaphelidium protococcarum]|nr:hypothetical protein MP228_011018 [Amoeboaphelidium protococcarum]
MNLKLIKNVIGWLPVAFVVSLLIWAWQAYTVNLWSHWWTQQQAGWLILLIFQILFLLLMWTYYRVVMTDPGSPLHYERLRLQSSDLQHLFHNQGAALDSSLMNGTTNNHNNDSEDALITATVKSNGQRRHCKKCHVWKPDRCHHDSMSQRCVLKFDHFCPWINNCVGHYTQKYFVLFLFYVVVFSLYTGLTTLPIVMNIKGVLDIQTLFLTIIGCIFGAALTLFFAMHLYYVIANKTTLEAFDYKKYQVPVRVQSRIRSRPSGLVRTSGILKLFGRPQQRTRSRSSSIMNTDDSQDGFDIKYVNMFNVGWRLNFMQVFGSNPYLWLLPVQTTQGDGLSYPCVTSSSPLRSPPTHVNDLV